jgi:chloramphenicol O-acetyltransferase type A
MRYLDIENWKRKAHYNYFKELDYPHFSICGNVDVTEFSRLVKDNESSFFIAFLYASVKAANSIEEFRYRIRQDKVVVHDRVSPSFTMMTSKEVFGFCVAEFEDNYSEFYKSASRIPRSSASRNRAGSRRRGGCQRTIARPASTP